MDLLQDRYEIQKTLGDRDGHKTVLARDRQTETFVVIKLLIFNSDLNWETVKRFEREANTLKSLNHPAIPQYLDYFDIETEAGKGFALVQSFIAAHSLGEQVQAGRRFSEDELKAIARALLNVFSYLHSRQPPIIHRDIKPSNILLATAGKEPPARLTQHDLSAHLFLVDFGSVQAMQKEGNTLTVVGTYGYMPPEQFGNRAVPASDLYGLGATLITLACGQHPADLPQKDLRIHFKDQVSLSPGFIHWLQAMVEPALEKRFSSAQVALSALDNNLPLSLASTDRVRLSGGKPAGSKIAISKQFDQLTVVINPKGFTLELVPIVVFACVWNLFMVNWYAIVFRLGAAGWFPGLFAIGHLGVGLGMIVKILYTLRGSSILKIDAETISLTHQLFGLTYQRTQPADRRHISQVETQIDVGRRHRRRRTVFESFGPQLNIWAGTKKFVIGGHDHLSKVEIEWLAQELGDWLEVPVHT